MSWLSKRKKQAVAVWAVVVAAELVASFPYVMNRHILSYRVGLTGRVASEIKLEGEYNADPGGSYWSYRFSVPADTSAVDVSSGGFSARLTRGRNRCSRTDWLNTNSGPSRGWSAGFDAPHNGLYGGRAVVELSSQPNDWKLEESRKGEEIVLGVPGVGGGYDRSPFLSWYGEDRSFELVVTTPRGKSRVAHTALHPHRDCYGHEASYVHEWEVTLDALSYFYDLERRRVNRCSDAMVGAVKSVRP